MLRCTFRLVLCITVIAVLALSAVAECGAPAHSGLALCFPSTGSTVLYPATIEMAANSGSTAITHVSVYDGNVEVDSLDFMPEKLIDFAIKNGSHRITVNAWDTNGKLYQVKSSFTVTGFGFGACAAGGGAITLCSPTQGSYVPEGSVLVSTAFANGVKSWSIAMDGTPQITSAQIGQRSGPLETSLSALAGSHSLTVSAVDATGVKSTVTRRFSTFYNDDCNSKSGTCRPGIEITQPTDIGEDSAGDEGTSFQVKAAVTGNPKPMTKMILYLDGAKVQQSTGPEITAEVNAAKGSHYIVILAWDTTGNMYETYGNVNVH